MSNGDDRGEAAEEPAPSPEEEVGRPVEAPTATPLPPEPRSRTRRHLIVGGSLAVVLVVAGAVLALVRSAIGDPRDALRALPKDTAVVFNADLFALRDIDSYDALLDALAHVLREQGEIRTEEDPIEALLTEIETESGIDVREDVLPWIGRSVAIGAGGDVTADVPEFLVFSLSVRSESGARAFFTEVLPNLDDPPTIDTTEVAGHETIVLAADEENPGYLAITDGLAVLAASEDALETSLAVLDDDAGNSILDNPRFTTALDRAPGDAWMNVYVDGTWIADTVTEAVADLEQAGRPGADELVANVEESLESLQSVGIWGKVADEVIVIEAWAIGDELGLPGSSGFTGIGDDVLRSLPRDTFLVMGGGGGGRDAVPRAIEEFAGSDPAAMAELRQASIDAVDFDIFDELLAGLGNHFFLAVLPDDGSIAAQEPGMSLLLGASMVDAALVAAGIEQLNDSARRSLGEQVRTNDGLTEIVAPGCGDFLEIVCDGWVSAEFPVFEDEPVLEQRIAELVDRYGREIAVVAVFDDGNRGRSLGADFGDAWGMSDDRIVVLVDLDEAQMFVSASTASGVVDPAGAESSFPEGSDLSTAIDLVLGHIEAQLTEATVGETLGGRTPDDAFALAGDPVVAFGIRGDRLYVATSAGLVSGLGGSSSLPDNPSLGAIGEALEGSALVLFGDVTTLEEIGVIDPGTMPPADGTRMAFGAGITQEEGAVGFRMVFAIVE